MSTASKSFVFLILAVLVQPAISDEIPDQRFSWGGFATQGWSITDNNNFYGNSEDSNGSFDFREVGVHATYEFSPEFNLNGQVLSRWAGRVDSGTPSVDYLFADWSFLQTPAHQAGLRAGRIKNPIGFYNDTRDVAFTRPSALLPQSIYLDRVRELELSSDGLGIYYRNLPSYGSWLFDLQYGTPQTGKDSELSLLGRDWDGGFDDSELLLLRILYEHGGGQYKFAITAIEADAPFRANSGNPFSDGNVEFTLLGLSGQINLEKWSLTAEYVEEQVERDGFSAFFAPADNTIQAYYIQADYRFTSAWSAFLRYDEVIVDSGDRDGFRYQSTTGLPAHQRFAKDWTVGLGYQPTHKTLLRLEFHHINGTAWLSSLDNPQPLALSKRWNMLLVQASYRF